jgi:predicted CXXCH cytochrome family protein
MKGGGQDRLPQTSVIVLAIVVAASSLLLAQTAQEQKTGTAVAGDQTLVANTQEESPASTGQPETKANADDAAAENVRKQMLRGLIGSKHDFARDDESGRDVCATCHTPHLGGVPTPRLDSRVGAPQLLRPYEGIEVELDGWSLLCLGCHDGTTAPDVYTSSHATTISSQLGNSRLGTRGLRSHPVGVKYAPKDERYNPRAAVEAAGLKLPNGRIECTTCHDPHNTHGYPGMLKASNHRSRLCLTCHRL